MRLPEDMYPGRAGFGLNDVATLVITDAGSGQRALALLALFAPGLPRSGA